MKKIFLGIIALLVVVLGARYYFSESEKEGVDEPKQESERKTDQEEFTRDGETWKRYQNADLELRFEYRIRPNGYVLVEQNESEIPLETAVEHLSLFNEAEYAELMESGIPREGPLAISVIVYENPDEKTARAWAEDNRMVSQIDLLLSDIAETTLSGHPAVRYRADGLYVSDVLVVQGSHYIYFISGAYVDEDSAIRSDFLEMLEYIVID